MPKTLLAHSESGIPGRVCTSAEFAASNHSVSDFILCETFAQHHRSVTYPTCQLGLYTAICVRLHFGRLISHLQCAVLLWANVAAGGEIMG